MGFENYFHCHYSDSNTVAKGKNGGGGRSASEETRYQTEELDRIEQLLDKANNLERNENNNTIPKTEELDRIDQLLNKANNLERDENNKKTEENENGNRKTNTKPSIEEASKWRTSQNGMRGLLELDLVQDCQDGNLLQFNLPLSSDIENKLGRENENSNVGLRRAVHQLEKTAVSESDYLTEGSKKTQQRPDLAYTLLRNMPKWAEEEAKNNGTTIQYEYAKASEFYEQFNNKKDKNRGEQKSVTFREFKIALPQDFTLEQNIKVLNEIIDEGEFGHLTTFAVIHDKEAQLMKTIDNTVRNTHAHLIFYDRIPDQHERNKEHYFSNGEAPGRYKPKNPDKGPCQKSDTYTTSSIPLFEKQLKKVRKVIENVINRNYKELNIDKFVFAGTNKELLEKSKLIGDTRTIEMLSSSTQKRMTLKETVDIEGDIRKDVIQNKKEKQDIRDRHTLENLQKSPEFTDQKTREYATSNPDTIKQILEIYNIPTHTINNIITNQSPLPLTDNTPPAKSQTIIDLEAKSNKAIESIVELKRLDGVMKNDLPKLNENDRNKYIEGINKIATHLPQVEKTLHQTDVDIVKELEQNLQTLITENNILLRRISTTDDLKTTDKSAEDIEKEITDKKRKISKDPYRTAIRQCLLKDTLTQDEIYSHFKKIDSVEWHKERIADREAIIIARYYKTNSTAQAALLRDCVEGKVNAIKIDPLDRKYCTAIERSALRGLHRQLAELEKTITLFEKTYIIPNVDKIETLKQASIKKNSDLNKKIDQLQTDLNNLNNPIKQPIIKIDIKQERKDIIDKMQQKKLELQAIVAPQQPAPTPSIAPPVTQTTPPPSTIITFTAEEAKKALTIEINSLTVKSKTTQGEADLLKKKVIFPPQDFELAKAQFLGIEFKNATDEKTLLEKQLSEIERKIDKSNKDYRELGEQPSWRNPIDRANYNQNYNKLTDIYNQLIATKNETTSKLQKNTTTLKNFENKSKSPEGIRSIEKIKDSIKKNDKPNMDFFLKVRDEYLEIDKQITSLKSQLNVVEKIIKFDLKEFKNSQRPIAKYSVKVKSPSISTNTHSSILQGTSQIVNSFLNPKIASIRADIFRNDREDEFADLIAQGIDISMDRG